jgi:tetratricopeptide (TPR) repeat protein
MTGSRPKAGVAWSLLLSLVSSPLALIVAPSSAWAQADPQQKAAAEALFDEGKQLLSQGQFESACRRFEQSQEIDPGVGTLLYLGDCYERSGRLASAWAIYREASSAAAAAGQGERTRIADERARRLAPNLSKLVLLVPQDNRVAGFELLLDHRVLSPALFGVPFPVDAGQHEISARAPGRSTWSNVIEIKPNADYRNLQIPSLSVASPSAPGAIATPYDTPAQGAGATAAAPAAGSAAADLSLGAAAPPSAPGPDRTASYIVGGAGVVAIGIGVAFGLRASDKDDESKAGCPSGCITRAAADLNQQARTAATIANISYAVGALALATSAYLFFSAGSGSETAARLPSGSGFVSGVSFDANLIPGAGQVSLSGQF